MRSESCSAGGFTCYHTRANISVNHPHLVQKRRIVSPFENNYISAEMTRKIFQGYATRKESYAALYRANLARIEENNSRINEIEELIKECNEGEQALNLAILAIMNVQNLHIKSCKVATCSHDAQFTLHRRSMQNKINGLRQKRNEAKRVLTLYKVLEVDLREGNESFLAIIAGIEKAKTALIDLLGLIKPSA